MKTLVLCTPRPEVSGTEIAPHVQAEMAALSQLHEAGILAEAYSPGGPGAVLIFAADRNATEAAVGSLPLVAAGLIEAQVIELQPFPGFSS